MQQKTNESKTRKLQLRAYTKIYHSDAESGFIETGESIFRIRSTSLHAIIEHLLPLLDGKVSLQEIIDILHPHLSETQILLAVDALQQQDLLIEPTVPGTDSIPVSHFIVTGMGDVAPLLLPMLQDIMGTATTQFMPIITMQDLDQLEQQILAQEKVFVIVATASLFDPRIMAIYKLCIDRSIPCLFFGMSHLSQCFVGPLWLPNENTPCYRCFQLRYFMNSDQGEIYESYRVHLAKEFKLPVQLCMAQPLRYLLASLVAESIWYYENSTQTHFLRERIMWIDGTTDSSERTFHHLLRVPGCQMCSQHHNNAHENIKSIGTLRHGVDKKTGIVHKTQVTALASTDPRIYAFSSTSSNMSFLAPSLQVITNAGAGYSEEMAYNAAIGESLERYAASIYNSSQLLLSTQARLKEEALHPEELCLFSSQQYAQEKFPFVPFTEDTPVRWIRATNYVDQRPIWVPAFLTYLPYRVAKSEAKIMPSISTGLAAGPSLAAAILSGLYEVIERDAFAISWLHRLPPQALPANVLNACHRIWSSWPEHSTYRLHFFTMTLDIPCAVVLSIIEHQSANGPVMTVGCAARLSFVDAAEKAFLEAAQGLPYIRSLLTLYENWQPGEEFEHTDTFQKHAVLYSKFPALRDHVGYLLHLNKDQTEYRNSYAGLAMPEQSGVAEQDLKTLAQILRQMKYSVLFVDLTPPDLRQLGVHVARVIVPGLQHISGNHRYRMLGNARLYEVVKKLGYRSLPDNTYPHPLP